MILVVLLSGIANPLHPTPRSHALVDPCELAYNKAVNCCRPNQHFQPRVGKKTGLTSNALNTAMTPLRAGKPVTSASEAVAALQERVATEVLMLCQVTDADDISSMQAKYKLQKTHSGSEYDPSQVNDSIQVLSLKPGEYVMAYATTSEKQGKCVTLVMTTGAKSKKGWIRSSFLEPLHVLEIQIIKVDVHAPRFEQCELKSAASAELATVKSAEMPRFCKLCKAVFIGHTCSNLPQPHAIFQYTKVIPEGMSLLGVDLQEPEPETDADEEGNGDDDEGSGDDDGDVFYTPRSTNPGCLTLNELPHNALSESMCWLSIDQAELCQKNGLLGDIEAQLPCWVSQKHISEALFGSAGAATVVATTAATGSFAWATEFANVHATMFYREHPIDVSGETYQGSEHYFQLQKSFGTPSHKPAKAAMMAASTAEEAWTVGQTFELRADWEDAKVGVMREAVNAKFTQNTDLRALLLSTRDFPLVHLKTNDAFWGSGSEGTGKNTLGLLLMELRSALRSVE